MASGDVNVSVGLNPLAKRGYFFDGVDDRLTLSIPSNFDRTNDFSVNIWMKLYSIPGGATSYCIASTGITATSSRFIIGVIPSSTACIWMKTNKIVDQSEITDLKWHMLTLTYNKATAKAYGYVDGVLKNAGGTSIIDTSTNAPITIADASFSPGTGYTKCSIGKLTFYLRSLTQAEITALYNSNTIPEDVYCNFPLQEDILDRTGRFTATAASSPFVLPMDDVVATDLKSKRTTGGSTGKYFLKKLGKNLMTIGITG